MASRGEPEMGQYLGNQVIIETTLKKYFTGTFNGYDKHMNIVVDNLQELDDEKKPTGPIFAQSVLRGHSVLSVESMDSIDKKR